MKRPYLGGAGKDYDLHPDTCKRCLTGIDDDYVCSFWTRDGEKFPLLK